MATYYIYTIGLALDHCFTLSKAVDRTMAVADVMIEPVKKSLLRFGYA